MKENCMTTHFNEFALSPALQESLSMMNFSVPTPIQAMAIPFGLEGRDILGSAQTGTGKTAAFCIPMIDYLIKNPSAHALVMLPTRELATQVHDVARKMLGLGSKGPEGIKSALLIGGEPISKQYVQLNRRPRLIVGTPGRINDHLRGNPDLVDRVSFVVLDEADRMLDMGFSTQIDSILSETALERQTLMFSATFPDSIIRFSKQYLQNPERISAGVQSKPGENIIQENLQVPQEKKYDELQTQLVAREGSVIIFVRTKHGADKLAAKLIKDGHAADALHGGLRQRQREKVIASFRKDQIRILVATDVAARGLDVPHIEHVINHDLPQVAEDYIHRIGRTARAGNKGHAVSFISPGERGLWREIEKMLDPSVKNYDSGMREEGGRKPSGGKKFGGGKSYGNKDGYAGRERDGGARKGSFGARKPFGRPDRGDRKEGGYHPAADFDRAPRENREGGERNFANNPDSYKRTTSGDRKEGGFKKPYNRDGASAPRQYNGDRPFRKEGGERSFNKPREGGNGEGRSYAPREGGFNKPSYSKDGERSYNKPGERSYKPRTEGGNNEGRSFKPRTEGSYDRPRTNNGDRPFRKEGGYQGNRDGNSQGGERSYNKPREGGNSEGRSYAPRSSEGGFKKPYNKDGAGRSEGGFKKPYNKEGGFKKREGGGTAPKSGAVKRIAQRNSGGASQSR